MRAEKWCEHQPKGVIESEVKLLRDFNIQSYKVIKRRIPNKVVVEKWERIRKIIDVAVPNDSRVNAKEQEKVEKYQEIRWEVARVWKMKKVELILAVVETLGTVTNKTQLWLKKIGVEVGMELIQKTSLLGTARMLKKCLILGTG